MSGASRPQREETVVIPLLLVLLVVLILFGIGFAANILWILAAVLLAIWLVGFFARGVEGARWYRW
jgi:hypothetical protein